MSDPYFMYRTEEVEENLIWTRILLNLVRNRGRFGASFDRAFGFTRERPTIDLEEDACPHKAECMQSRDWPSVSLLGTGRPSWCKICTPVVRLATAFLAAFLRPSRLSTSGLKGQNEREGVSARLKKERSKEGFFSFPSHRPTDG